MVTYISIDRKVQVTVEVENTGEANVKGYFWFKAYYGKSLSNSTGNPLADDDIWADQADTSDSYGDSAETTLSPGERKVMIGSSPVAVADYYSEGDLIDVGVVVGVASSPDMVGEEGHADSLKKDNEISIGALRITGVNFSSYKNPSTLNVRVKNTFPTPRDATIDIYVDGVLTYEVSETISANTEQTISIDVAYLRLSKGEHFVFCEMAR